MLDDAFAAFDSQISLDLVLENRVILVLVFAAIRQTRKCAIESALLVGAHVRLPRPQDSNCPDIQHTCLLSFAFRYYSAIVAICQRFSPAIFPDSRSAANKRFSL